MLEFQALKLRFHRIAVRLNTVNYRKFYAAPQLTGAQKLSESLHVLSITIIIMQAVKDFSNLCQHILNRCTVKLCYFVEI